MSITRPYVEAVSTMGGLSGGTRAAVEGQRKLGEWRERGFFLTWAIVLVAWHASVKSYLFITVREHTLAGFK